jgi:hypothetical protein
MAELVANFLRIGGSLGRGTSSWGISVLAESSHPISGGGHPASHES